MLSGDLAELQHLLSPNLISMQNNSLAYHFSSTNYPLHYLQNIAQFQGLNRQPTSLSGNSTSDEADNQQLTVINERKQRRMISNRESARRSRMRKQRHLDELWSQVLWLRHENHQLINKLNNAFEDHDRVVQENAQLKEETSGLRQIIADMKFNSPFPSVDDLDEINHDKA